MTIANKKFGPSIYYYHDKAIFDGLSQHNISKQKIQSILLKKGVILSSESDKSDCAFYLSSFAFDFFDKTNLSDLLRVVPRRENISSCTIKTSTESNDEEVDITSEQVRIALNDLKGSLTTDNSDMKATVRTSTDAVYLDVTYKNYDLTKPEIKQVETKNAQLEVYIDEGELTVRSPSNDFCSNLVDQFKSSLIKETNFSLDTEQIDLSIVSDAALVSKFFEYLIKNIEGYKFVDVTNVKLYHPDPDVEDDEITSHIQKAMLHGEGVLISPELKGLFNRGFHLSKVQWLMIDPLPNGDQVSFEASLKKPSEKNGFTYQIRGIKRFSSRTQGITQKLDTPSNLEKKIIHKKIETAAMESFEKVIADDEAS
ncbi:MAG: hypothetical protein OCD00_15765 [Colwellia sp.]